MAGDVVMAIVVGLGAGAVGALAVLFWWNRAHTPQVAETGQVPPHNPLGAAEGEVSPEFQEEFRQYQHQVLRQAWVAFALGGLLVLVGGSAALWKVWTAPEADAASLVRQALPGLALLVLGVVLVLLAYLEEELVGSIYRDVVDLIARQQTDALVDQIDNEHIRAAVKAQLSLHRSGVVSSPLDLTPLPLPTDRHAVAGRPFATGGRRKRLRPGRPTPGVRADQTTRGPARRNTTVPGGIANPL